MGYDDRASLVLIIRGEVSKDPIGFEKKKVGGR